MRPFVTSSFLLVVAACADEYDSNPFQADYTVEVVGSFERVNPHDPLSQWIGVEITRIQDRHGQFVCDDVVDADGPALADNGAELTLDMVRAELREIGESCAYEFGMVENLTSGVRYLAFDGEEGRFGEERGVVRSSSDFDQWADYAVGLRIGDALTYHSIRAFTEPNDGPAEAPDWEHKPLQELPIY